jgi:hypothetical protein
MMSNFKIPSFISGEFSKLQTKEQKEEMISRYKRWSENEFTLLLIEYLEEEYEKLLKEDEEKSDFLSKFQFSYISIRNKAKRGFIRSLIKKLDYTI